MIWNQNQNISCYKIIQRSDFKSRFQISLFQILANTVYLLRTIYPEGVSRYDRQDFVLTIILITKMMMMMMMWYRPSHVMMLLSVARERLMLSAFPLSSALALIGQTDCLHVTPTASINVPCQTCSHMCTTIYATKYLCSNKNTCALYFAICEEKQKCPRNKPKYQRNSHLQKCQIGADPKFH